MIKIMLVGDIGLFGKFSGEGGKSLLKPLSGFFSSYDLVIGNLEVPLTRSNKTYGAKSAFLKGNPDDVELLKLLNVSAVSLSNNHLMDFGRVGLEDTVEILESNGIEHYGHSGKDTHFNLKGNKIALNGFCSYDTNPQGISLKFKKNKLHAYTPELVEEWLSAAIHKGCLPIISVHSGIEHVSYPSCNDVKLARRLSDKFTFVYHGHHPHAIQPIEFLNKSVIAYSLGNFCFDDVYDFETDELKVQKEDINNIGLLVELCIDNNKIISHRNLFIQDHGNQMCIVTQSKRFDELQAVFESSVNLAFETRVTQRSRWVSARKNKRNFKWFIARFRYRYLRLLVTNFFSRFMYRLFFHNKIF